jgi:[NiFe] hydrogenase large subunit
MLKEQIKFIEEVYIPDLLAVAGFYKDWAAIGGNKNFLSYGDFPEGDVEPDSFYFKRGAIFDGKLELGMDPQKITEDVAHSWYEGDKPCIRRGPDQAPPETVKWFRTPRGSIRIKAPR